MPAAPRSIISAGPRDRPCVKSRIEELAVFDGPPAFREPLHVGRPNVGRTDRLLERIRDVVEGLRLTNNGPLLSEFEARVADLAGVRHCVATCNGTLALQVAARALGLRGEVIVPSFTFVATVHALRWQGLTPVFCDVDPATHNIDPRRIEALITPRTTGIVGVHLWGRPCEIEALAPIAARHGLVLLFDASHAFGCSRGGRMVGGFGDAEVFSFHATKFLNTFEGGAIVTNRDDVAARSRRMINFGFAGPDDVVALGINGKMSEAAAAMGLTGLDSLDEFVAAGRRNYRLYRAALEGLPGLRVAVHDESERCNYHYVVLEVDEREAAVSRDDLVEVLHAENVLARRYFFPGCHRMEPYRSERPGLSLPVTERLAARVLLLPTGTALGPEDVDAVCAIVRVTTTGGRAVKRRLGARRVVGDVSPAR
jgi:dTDP-4-amino-4,6-dideoxygalactose transaminase